MPLFLDLTAARPLDLLLSTERSTTSAVIRMFQAISRRRQAPYSHVALLLSNSVLVEAIGPSGTVLSSLVATTASLPRAPDFRNSGQVYCRSVDGEIRVYAQLHGKSAAVLARHKSADEMLSRHGWQGFNELLLKRFKSLELLVDVYLASYSNLGRLLRPIVGLPASIQAIIERSFEAGRARRRKSGPFCSELVGILLAEVFGEKIDNAKMAPIDFVHAGSNYEVVKCAVFEGEVEHLPGTEHAAWLGTELVSLLCLPGLQAKIRCARLLKSCRCFPR